MLTLLSYLFEKLDFIPIVEMLRQRNNRKIAANLLVIYIKACEIIELHKTLLGELQRALDSHQQKGDAHRFTLNPHRVIWLLQQQAGNLETMDNLVGALTGELRIFHPELARLYREITPGKGGILLFAQQILWEGRLPAAESTVVELCLDENGKYRTLWFGELSGDENRKEIERYLHGDDGRTKHVVDVNVHDGNEFFQELQHYFTAHKPLQRIAELEEQIDAYRQTLIENFTVADILSDVRNVL